MPASDYTVRDLITDALLELGVIGPADPTDSEIFDLAVRRVFGMYSTFQAMRLLLFTVARTVYPLTANQQVHTIGPVGCDLTAPRPLWIARAGVIPVDQTDLDLPLYEYTRAEWFDERLKGLTDLYPRKVLYEPATETTGTFTFWPIQTTACQLSLATPVPLTVPSGDLATVLSTVLTFAPGYQEAWLYNLAKRLARPFNKKVSADLFEDARASLAVVKRLNDEAPPPSRCDAAISGRGRGGYDIRSNQYR